MACDSASVNARRRQRAKRENTFLESVKESLLHILEEVSTVKTCLAYSGPENPPDTVKLEVHYHTIRLAPLSLMAWSIPAKSATGSKGPGTVTGGSLQ